MYDSVTQRIKDIIDNRFSGNVSAFSKALGHSSPQKINRLFLKDKRSGNYPTASIEILTEISNKLDFTLDYLVKGIDDIDKNDEVVIPELIDQLKDRLKEKDKFYSELILEKEKRLHDNEKRISDKEQIIDLLKDKLAIKSQP